MAVTLGGGREVADGSGVEVGADVGASAGEAVGVNVGVHTGVWGAMNAVRCNCTLVPLCQTPVWLANTPPISN